MDVLIGITAANPCNNIRECNSVVYLPICDTLLDCFLRYTYPFILVHNSDIIFVFSACLLSYFLPLCIVCFISFSTYAIKPFDSASSLAATVSVDVPILTTEEGVDARDLQLTQITRSDRHYSISQFFWHSSFL